MSDASNYYEILEISPNASSSDIHKAYQQARSTYSGDNPALYSMFSPEEARELLKMIEEAYAVLSNQISRRNYDAKLSGVSAQPAAVASAPASSSTAAHSALEEKQSSFTPATPVSTDIAVSENYTVRKKEGAAAPLPAGTARTQLSTYKIDDAFETELVSAKQFDGAFLQKIRTYKNITIDRMSEATRISRTYLMAVETNDYKNLPAAVFVRGFIVQVARYLGLDENKVASSYMQIFKAGGGQ